MKNKHPFFLNISPKVASDPAAPFAVLPLPYERTVSYGTGTAKGPAAILRASREIEDFDEELKIPVNLKVQTLRPPKFDKLNDIEALNVIRKTAESVMKQKRFLLSLGGEHTITSALVSAAYSSFGKISVLQLDAHTDLRDRYRNSKQSHACVMKRIRDMGIPTVHVGIRSCSAEEYAYYKKERIPVFWAKDICACRDRKWMARDAPWIKKIINKLSNKVYVTVDIDVFDTVYAPGTGTPEPGGLNWYMVTSLLKEVFRKKEVVAADIVEVAPIPGSQVTEFVAARLGAKMLMYKKIIMNPSADG